MEISFTPVDLTQQDLASQPPLPPMIEKIIEAHLQQLVAEIANTSFSDLTKDSYMRGISFLQGQISVLKFYLEMSKWAASDHSEDVPVQGMPRQLSQ